MNLSEFFRCYERLLANWYLFPEPVRLEAEKVRHEVHDALASWRPGSPRPAWDLYSERLNTVLRDNGLPQLFLSSPR
jgi:hypothetical protein